MSHKEQTSQSPSLNLTVEYSPDLERMLEALMVALGLPEEEIRAMLAARSRDETIEEVDTVV